MFENSQLGPEVLANPGMVQSLIITEFQNRLNGTVSVADPNNAFCFILEAGSSVVAQAVRLAEKKFETLYPVRAVTAAELYPHMSDFDYLNLTAAPAPVSFNLILDKDWLIANSTTFDTNYNKVIIPDSTTINLGGRTFSLYYPIQIMINRTTGSILATWDLSVENPLMSFDSNFLTDVVEYTVGGLNLLSMTFTAYQFATTTTKEVSTVSMGFNKTYSYSDQFYAARVYSLINGVWTELAYTLSQTIYDPTTPTAILTIMSDNNTLQVQIPQVYFTTGALGQQVMVKIYTTQGALNVAIAQTEAQSITANFDTGSSPYAAILAQPPTIVLIPQNQTQIVGGSNGMSFTQLRQSVINADLYSQVPITPLELTAAANKLGFSLTKYLDNITDRIYFASSTLKNAASGLIVPLGILPTYFDLATLSNTSTILSYGDNVTTILPTTLFMFNATNNLCVPLSDADVRRIASLSTSDLAAALNANTHTRQPYHVVLYSSQTYPAAKTFDLTTPSATNLNFVTENASSPVQLTVASISITHLQAGTGGYQIAIGIKRSISLGSADPSTFYVVLSTKDRQSVAMQLRATYQSSTTLLDIYTVNLSTDYHITQDLYIRTTMDTNTGASTLTEIPLSSTFSFYLGVSAAANSSVSQSPALQPFVPSVYTDMLAVSLQTATLTFGADLSQSVYNVVTSTWGSQPYQTYPETIYHTYDHDVYASNPDGTLVTTVVANGTGGNTVLLTKTHSRGDQVLDGSGNPVVKYSAGSIQLDANGNPVALNNRSVVFTVQMLQLDAKLYSSTDLNDTNYVSGFSALLNSTLVNLGTLKNNLLERTALYYKPSRTLGLATYGIGGGKTIQLPLGLSFDLTFYVSDSILNDVTQRNLLTATTQQIITTAVTQNVISLTAITSSLQQTFDTKVSAIDVGGINGNTSLQTLSLVDTDAVSSVAIDIVVNSDGSLSLQPAINITFVLSPT